MIRGAIAAGLLLAASAQADPASDLAADVESIEACVLESAVASHAEDCIGLIADGCRQDGFPPTICHQHEMMVWSQILANADGVHPNEKTLNVLARASIMALLAAE